jgi:uncharacterized protein
MMQKKKEMLRPNPAFRRTCDKSRAGQSIQAFGGDKMNSARWCDFEKLEEVIIAQFRAGSYSVHGPSHWRRVEQNGLWLALRTSADTFVTRLFAWFHDSRRENDFTDPDHGLRGAQYAAILKGSLFDLEDSAFDLLYYACEWHTDRVRSEDITIGTCWDSDRLDLGRIGTIPSEEFMSTAFGRQVAKAGSFYTFVSKEEKAEPVRPAKAAKQRDDEGR